MAVKITISIDVNSQSIANNTSNVTVTVRAVWTGGSYNKLQKSGWLKIDGTTYNFTSAFNTSQTTSGTGTLFTKTVNVAHNSNGTKTLACSASYTSGVSSGTVAASASKALNTIPRASSLSASNGTLGTAQTLTINKADSSFLHTITYKCGSATGTICTKSSSASVSWTPPLSLASQNTTGTTVAVAFTLTTFNSSGTQIGTAAKSISCTIPASVKPSCSIAVSDPTGNAAKYGGFVRGLSQFKVTVTGTPAQGSPISAYKTTANGSTYTTSTFTTGALQTAGSLKITATVTDKRGRSGTATVTQTVLDYTTPEIIQLAVLRCNSDGTANDKGEYVKVTFKASVSSLDSQNTAAYTLKYKKSSEAEYTVVSLTEYDNVYSVTDGEYIFAADTGSSYNIEFSVTDAHTTTARATTASTGFVLMHFNTAGNGMGIGKTAEVQDALDIGVLTRHYGGLLPPVLEAETDLNEVRTPNTYTGENVSNYNYANCPVTSGTFTLLVESCGESGQVKQTYTTCSKYKPECYSRFYYQSEWGDWFWAGTDEVVLYESDSGSNGTITLAASASHYRYLEIYFTDNNGKTGGYTKVYSPNGKTVHLQITEPASTIYSRQTAYTISGTAITPDTTTASYYRITSAGAVSTSIGTNYIRIIRVIGRA